MITTRIGNALDAATGIIVHGCNCIGAFGAGFALAVKERYPYAYEAYKKDEAENGLDLGYFSYAEVAPNLFIVNAYTQLDYGTDARQVNYEAVAICFEKVVELAKDIQADRKLTQPLEIIFPALGSGLAGGRWRIIEAIIDETVPDDFKKVLYLLEAPKTERAPAGLHSGRY